MVKSIMRTRKGYSVIIGGLVHHKDKATPNLYAPNNIISKYIWQNLMKLYGGVNKSITTAED
jgi:hypothetical protein